MKLLTRSDDRNTSLGILERFAYMSGSFGTVLVYTLIGTYLLYYYTDVVGLSGTIIGSILLVSRILDGVSDLVMGAIVDRTVSRRGKTRVWLLRMCVPYAISGILVLSVPTGASDLVKYIFVAITYNLCCTVAYTAITVPYNAFLCNITGNAREHGILGVFSVLGGTVSGLIVQSTVVQATEAMGGGPRAWQIMGAVYAALSIVFHLTCYFFTKERCVSAAAEKDAPHLSLKSELSSLLQNQYWLCALFVCIAALLISGVMNAAGLYYANSLFGDPAYFTPIANSMSLGLVAGIFIAAVLMGKIGKRNTMLIGAVTSTLAGVGMGLFASTPTAAAVFSAIRGVMFGFITSGVYGMIADTIDFGEWKSGIRAEGIGLACITVGSKLATGLSSVIVGMAVERSGYDPGLAVQSESARSAMVFLLCWLPVILGVCIVVCLLLYQLDKLYPQVQKELDARRG